MRLRIAVLASVLTALAGITIPAVVSAAPRHNHGLTINATPNPILAGEGVTIYGQLNRAPVGGQTIVLYHHIAGSGRGYTPVSHTTTNGNGFYMFTRATGVVMTNRNWFVREAAGHGVRSRTIRERVHALVSLSASSSSTDTNHAIVFSGHVTPNHASEHALLQEQIGSSDDWRTLKRGRLGPGSNYAIAYRWRVPGQHDVRVVFPSDDRNIRGESDPLSVTIQQAQVADFTINTSAPIIDYGQSATISGVLYQPGTSTPEPNTAVSLCGRAAGQSHFSCSSATFTKGDGSYSFGVSPTQNTLYQARTSLPPHRHSAVLFEGVRDVVTMTASSNSSTVGGTVTFIGTVTPDKAGHAIYLQRLGKDGDWHTVEVHRVKFDSTFQFSWTFGTQGMKKFRARITSDRRNVGGASTPVTINVSPAPASSLPPGS